MASVFVLLPCPGPEGSSKWIGFTEAKQSTSIEKAASMSFVKDRGSPRGSVNEAVWLAYWETHVSLESFALVLSQGSGRGLGWNS